MCKKTIRYLNGLNCTIVVFRLVVFAPVDDSALLKWPFLTGMGQHKDSQR